MLSVVNILIIFFLCLILYQLFLDTRLIEGLENQYQPYDPNNPENALILAQQNAGNIAYIKERLDEYQNVYRQVQDLSGNYDVLEKQVNDLVAAQQDYANQITGGTAPEVSGTIDEEDEENKENNLSSSDFMTE
jgi:hypothetical protein